MRDSLILPVGSSKQPAPDLRQSSQHCQSSEPSQVAEELDASDLHVSTSLPAAQQQHRPSITLKLTANTKANIAAEKANMNPLVHDTVQLEDVISSEHTDSDSESEMSMWQKI